MKRVLVSAYTGLGNFVLKTPLLLAIEAAYPNCKIDIIAGSSYGAELILGQSPKYQILSLPESESWLKKVLFFIALRSKQYDCIFLAFDTNRKFLFFGSYLAGVKRRVVHSFLRYKFKTLLYLFSPQTVVTPVLQGRHEIDLNLDLLEHLINKPIIRNYDTFVVPSVKNQSLFERFRLISPYIVLQPGAANGALSAKKWPRDCFIELIKSLNSRFPTVSIVLVGDNGDFKSDIEPILSDSSLSCINTAGLTTVSEMLSIIEKASCVVANDSGVMHISNALKVPLIALYGPTDLSRTRPLSRTSNVLISQSEITGIMYNFSGNEIDLAKKYPDNMRGITVESVFSIIERVIDDLK